MLKLILDLTSYTAARKGKKEEERRALYVTSKDDAALPDQRRRRNAGKTARVAPARATRGRRTARRAW
jgi:hypothetical protein